jgi:hypothetical protein
VSLVKARPLRRVAFCQLQQGPCCAAQQSLLFGAQQLLLLGMYHRLVGTASGLSLTLKHALTQSVGDKSRWQVATKAE